MSVSGEFTADVAALDDSLRRLAERLRTMTDTVLGRPIDPAGSTSRADDVHALCVRLACWAQGVEERDRDGVPDWRIPPRLSDLASGDQLAVLGHDLVVALTAVGSGTVQVWTAEGTRTTAHEATAVAGEAVAALRTAL